MVILSCTLVSLTACSQNSEQTYPVKINNSQDTNTISTTEAQKSTKEVGYQLEKPASQEEIAVFKTNLGEFKIRLFPEECPKTVENFKALCSKGYYDGVTFHRVIKNFMIQGGDPTGTGMGGESIWGKAFEDEFCDKLFNITGAVAMANCGPNTNGSQFFINNCSPESFTWADFEEPYKEYKKNPSLYTKQYGTTVDMSKLNSEIKDLYEKVGGNPTLDGYYSTSGRGHTVFGQVFEGMDVVDKISNQETNSEDKPVQEIKIEKAEICKYA